VVSEWKPADESDERMLQRLLLLKDAAQGLKLLHSMNTVHGDLVGLQLWFLWFQLQSCTCSGQSEMHTLCGRGALAFLPQRFKHTAWNC
jgi:hypothetical protein